MVDPGTLTTLNALGDAVGALQKSARQTIPMFLVGILATIIAAGIALYYILTLTTELRDARHALNQSQAALSKAQADLAAVKVSLRQAQRTESASSEANSIATAISKVSQSQANIMTASNSIIEAATKLPPPNPAKPDPPKVARLASTDAVVPQNSPELEGRFRVVPTSDGFLALRSEPSMASTEIAKIPSGGLLDCVNARPNAAGNLWRPCTDEAGNSGFVANKFIRKQ